MDFTWQNRSTEEIVSERVVSSFQIIATLSWVVLSMQTHGRCDQKEMGFALIFAVVELGLQMLTVRGSVYTPSQASGDREPSVCLPHRTTA